MKELYLVRHAKSSWQLNEVDDIDRPLKKSGVVDAYAMSDFLQERVRPDLIITSPAVRSVCTALVFCRKTKFPYSQVVISELLYESNVEKILTMISGIHDDHRTIMLIGHNPSLTNLTNRLTELNIDNVPTFGVVGIYFEKNSWKEIASLKAERRKETDFFVPKVILKKRQNEEKSGAHDSK